MKEEEEVILELQLSELCLVCFSLRGDGALHLLTSSGSSSVLSFTPKQISLPILKAVHTARWSALRQNIRTFNLNF